MKKSILSSLAIVIAGLILTSLNPVAQAQSINGSIQFSGGAALNGPLNSATAFTNIIAGINPFPGAETGDYSSVPSSTPVAFFPFTFNPSPASPVSMWTFTVGATTYSFQIDSLVIDHQDSTFLNIMGTGTAHIDGFTDTLGTFTITDTGIGSSPVFTFGAGVNVVPEPATATCLMLGLGVLVLTRRFRQNGRA